jgi:DNA-binding transcriptional MerR regulator
MMFEIPPIPDKLFFRIGEVSELLGVEPYVLRYWESEFPALAPKKSSSGQRMFRRKDVDLLFNIKHLLYEKKFTIEGARKALQDQPKREQARKNAVVRQDSLFAVDPLPEIRKELADLIKLLS